MYARVDRWSHRTVITSQSLCRRDFSGVILGRQCHPPFQEPWLPDGAITYLHRRWLRPDFCRPHEAINPDTRFFHLDG